MQKHPWLLSTLLLSLVLVAGCSQSASNNVPQPSPPASETAAPTPVGPSPSSENAAPVTENSTSPQDNIDEAAAVAAASDYINVEYTVKASADILSDEAIKVRNETMKPFLTDYFYQKAVSMRYTTLPLKVSFKQHMSVKPDNLKFTLTDGTKKDIIELKYNVDLVLLDQEGKENQRVPMEGILTMFNVNGQWLVQGDRFDKAAFSKLIN